MKETLHTCPTCGTSGFTARSLKAHRCDGTNRQLVPIPNSSLEISHSEDAILGEQLTQQYGRAVGAMAEILKFGAMMIMLRETLSAREHSGHGRKGDGIKGWLAIHAPEINRVTAYRFMNVALAVSERFELPKKASFIDIATKPAEELPKALQKKQMELWDFVNGTSQRSWLDQFTPRGGSRERPNGTQRRTKAEKEFDDKATRATDWYKYGFAGIRIAHEDPENTWLHLDDQRLANLADLLKCFTKTVDEVCRSRKVVPSKLANWHQEDGE